MANINTYLNQILSATHGEEVRGAIHDSINAMNLESTEAISVASTAQDSAANSAENALTSKNAAESSADTASSAASTASSAADAALASKNAAETAKNNAQYSASNASSSASAAHLSEVSAVSAAANADALVSGLTVGGTAMLLGNAIYQDLTDSSGANLLDSSGTNISGRSLLAELKDILAINKDISDLKVLILYFLSLLVPNRLTSLEATSIQLDGSITSLQQHALLDNIL